MSKLLLFILSLVYVKGCYWNNQCPYSLYGSKTPYDTVRGDIRDYTIPDNCEAVSIWTMNRHGNRNPDKKVIAGIKRVLAIRDEILANYDQNNSELCAQDIENFSKWTWNSTIEQSQSFLTGFGYEELYNIAKRLREKYNYLLQGTADQFYFRPTDEQRTVTSCVAFVHGLTDGVNLDVTVEHPTKRDDVLRPYKHCDRYQKDVKRGVTLTAETESYFKSPEFVALQARVQKRLGIKTQLTADNVYSMYEMCRFYRSWSDNLQDPWCAVFTNEDIQMLEYYDDVWHYYRNGYGYQVNVDLGKIALKDLYENFEAVVSGQGRKIVSYFTHDTMMEMVYSAMGLYKDAAPLSSQIRKPNRLWRTSHIGTFSTNLIAVLNRCNETTDQTYRIQLFINEEVTPICPLEGCSWQDFQDKFQVYASTNLDFCSMDYDYPPADNSLPNSAALHSGFLRWN